jgi:hypothetical protein
VKGLLAKARAKLNTPEGQMALAMILLSQGLSLMIQGINARFERLEGGGMVPLDDVATVADLDRIDERVDGRVDARMMAEGYLNRPDEVPEPTEDGAET